MLVSSVLRVVHLVRIWGLAPVTESCVWLVRLVPFFTIRWCLRNRIRSQVQGANSGLVKLVCGGCTVSPVRSNTVLAAPSLWISPEVLLGSGKDFAGSW